ncbi:MAG: hypothetical protein RBS88_01895 [Spongiibacteraceae bacterium]|nr:hypothetical protein [Spongiibacteraceae bacterium]
MLLFAAVERWDVDPAELIGYFVASVFGLAIVIALAFACSLLLHWLRRK